MQAYEVNNLVLLAQFTSSNCGLFYGYFTVHGVDAVGNEWTKNVAYTEIPAPSTIAILEVAGLTIRRRRM